MTIREGASRLYNGETEINFIGRWKLWFLISGAVIVIGLAGLGFRGLNLGIDFKGGVSWEAPAGHGSVSGVRSAVTSAGLVDPNVQSLGSSSGTTIRIQAKKASTTTEAKVLDAISKETGSRASSISFNEVGPSWGSAISSRALSALLILLVIVWGSIAVGVGGELAVAMPAG